MHEQKPRTVPWIERISHWVPGYGGYLERGNRRSADQALRDVIARSVSSSKTALEAAVRSLTSRGELNKIEAVERVERHMSRVADRIRSAGSGTSEFYGSASVDPQKADSLHAFDFDLLERAEALSKHANLPDHDGDWLAHLESQLLELDRKLDERALALEGIR